MKTFNIVKYGNQEYCYRTFGNQYVKKLELFKGRDTVHGQSVVLELTPGELFADGLLAARNILENY